MQAKSNAPWPVTAFTGREFVTYEWRPVPAGYEEAAREHGLLDVRETPAGSASEIDATPEAVELAEEHGLNLADIEGTGAGGRILIGDVRDALAEEEE